MARHLELNPNDTTRNNLSMKYENALSALSLLLHEDGFCFTVEEGRVLGEFVLSSLDESQIEEEIVEGDALKKSLQDGLDINEVDAISLVSKLRTHFHILSENMVEADDKSEATEHMSMPNAYDDIDSDDDDGELLSEGECELCDRCIQLTKHHLIPRSTWPRIKTKLLHAAIANEEGDCLRAQSILGDGLDHVLPQLSTNKSKIRQMLQMSCAICRPCHSAIHKAHDNMSLALEYNTVEKLLFDDQISRFCKWASKQKTGKYSPSYQHTP